MGRDHALEVIKDTFRVRLRKVDGLRAVPILPIPLRNGMQAKLFDRARPATIRHGLRLSTPYQVAGLWHGVRQFFHLRHRNYDLFI